MVCQSIVTIIASCIVFAVTESPVDQLALSQNGVQNTYGVPPSSPPAAQFGPQNSRGGGRGNAQIGGFSIRPQDFGHPSGGEDNNINREPANYDFNYNVQDDQFGVQFQHQENRQGDGTRGSYKVLLPDGRIQHVEYEADENGFRPRIRYEDSPAGILPAGLPRTASGNSVNEKGSAGYQFKK